MAFDTETGFSADEAVVTVTGEVDLATADDLSKAVLLAGERVPSVVVDLTSVEFFDSSGVRAIVNANASVERLQVVCPPDNRRVRKVLDVVGLDALVPVHDALPGADA